MEAPWQQAVGEVWAMGDYPSLAPHLAAPATLLADRLGDGHGRRALDLGTGTGSAGLALAQRGWVVHGVDLCEPLLDVGRRAAEEKGLVIGWHHAPMEEVPLEDATVDATVSSFGTMFALDPAAVLTEIRRCTREGGALLFTAVPRTGVVGDLAAAMAEYLPVPPESAPDPFDWADDLTVADWLADGFEGVTSTRHVATWTFETPSLGLERLFAASPLHCAAEHVVPDRAEELRRELVRVLETWAQGTAVPVEFTLTSATRS